MNMLGRTDKMDESVRPNDPKKLGEPDDLHRPSELEDPNGPCGPEDPNGPSEFEDLDGLGWVARRLGRVVLDDLY